MFRMNSGSKMETDFKATNRISGSKMEMVFRKAINKAIIYGKIISQMENNIKIFNIRHHRIKYIFEFK